MTNFRWALLLALGLAAQAEARSRPSAPAAKRMPGNPTSQSRLTATQPQFDFGAVVQERLLTHDFVFHISTGDSLRILRTESACGCAVGKLKRMSYLSGDSGSVAVSYRTTLIEGPFEKVFSLYTNSAATPRVDFILKGTVIRAVAIDPPFLSLDGVQVGSAWKTEIQLRWNRPERPGFKAPAAPDFLTVGKPARAAHDSTLWMLPVALGPKARSGYYQDTLELPTSSRDWPRLRIPVQGTVDDYAVAKPLVVNLGQVKRGAEANASFLVVSSLPGAAIASVSSSREFLSASAEPADTEGKAFRIRLKTRGMPASGPVDTEIEVAVRSRHSVRLKVPVVGRFEE